MIKEKVKKQEKSNIESSSGDNTLAHINDTCLEIEINDIDNRKLPRSMVYMETICAADLLSKQDEQVLLKIKENIGEDATFELASMSHEELEKEIEDVMDEELCEKGKLKGVICRCYIEGCDCHEITPLGKIKEHFIENSELSPDYSVCRDYLQRHEECSFVEIYSDCFIAINNDTTTNVFKK